jgi:hypothetical protein
VSVGVNQPPNTQVIEQERRRIGRHLDDVARLAESDVPPSTFYGEVLKRLLDALAAPAGAVWLRSTQGMPQLHYQINLNQVGTERDEKTRQTHEQLLLAAMHQNPPQPIHLMPNTTVGPAQPEKAPPGNPTDHLLLLVPIIQNEQIVGLLEVFQNASRPLNAVQGFLQYMGLMADLCARYLRNQRMTQLAGQQQLWTQLEAFARQIHGSLNPIEVAYLVSNEGRRLVECDRVSVALRYGNNTRIEAVSGADVVERRSNLIKLMRILCDRVLSWGEKLVFQGQQDDTLPPKVLEALNNYLAESNSKLLVIQPLKDEREGKDTRRSRAVLVAECFEPPVDPQPLMGRLEVVARHATSALYNAVEHRRIPMRFLWMPMAKVQEGLGGKARAIWMLVCVGLTAFISAMILVPYPLKMDANGELWPEVRRSMHSPIPGVIKVFQVHPNDLINEDHTVAEVFDLDQDKRVKDLNAAMNSAKGKLEASKKAITDATNEQDRAKARLDAAESQREYDSRSRELTDLLEKTKGDHTKEGTFYLKSPMLLDSELSQLRRRPKAERKWKVLSPTFAEDYTGKGVKPSDPIMTLGVPSGPWEIKLKIPQKHIGQIKSAMLNKPKNDDDGKGPYLQVDFLLRTDPTQTFQGKLRPDRISGEATPPKDETAEAEPVVMAFVEIDIDKIPESLRVAGTEVRAKVRCGDAKLGYSLFYGVWEFMYEKVVFFF